MISVIIPMYNSSSTIIRCLDSVLSQTYQDFFYEVIIVNDGSKDDSRELVENYIKDYHHPNYSIVLINQNNGGVSKARNIGLRNGSGEYIAFLDSDDEWFSDKVENQMQILSSSDNAVDFIGSGYEGLYFNKKQMGELIKMSAKALLYKNYFQPSSVMMKREIVENVGFFDETQRYAEEGNYFIRIAHKYNCYFLNLKLINFGDGKAAFGDGGLSGNILEMEKGELKNMKVAYKMNIINFVEYTFLIFFSIAKYFRRWLIVKLK